MEGEKLILCCSVKNSSFVHSLSFKRNCSKCNEEVWVSQTSRSGLAMGYNLICLDCFSRLPSDGLNIEPFTNEQLEELSEYFTEYRISSN